MDAALLIRIVPVEGNRTQIALEGSYEPPLGPVGAAVDATVGHHVAEAAVYRFVRDIVGRIEETSDSSTTP